MEKAQTRQPTKIEITQDKLVDLLLHAATREDIAKLASSTKSDNHTLRVEIKEDIAKLAADTKNDNLVLRTEIKEDIAALKFDANNFAASMDRQFQKIDIRYNWIIGILITGIIGVIGLMGHGFHMF